MELKTFVKDFLEENSSCFLVQMSFILQYMGLNKSAQIEAYLVKKNIGFNFEYADYAQVFLSKKAVELLKYSRNDYKIII